MYEHVSIQVDNVYVRINCDVSPNQCIFFLLNCLFDIADVCRFGSDSRCIFPCHCQSNDRCDRTTGHCDNICQQDILQGGPFSGPGCQIGKTTDHCPLIYLQDTYRDPFSII